MGWRQLGGPPRRPPRLPDITGESLAENVCETRASALSCVSSLVDGLCPEPPSSVRNDQLPEDAPRSSQYRREQFEKKKTLRSVGHSAL